ncbi:MAG: hypothetical protein CME59_20080 [Halioglobus sp.]|nr:hypothetical protein [Halioglobus sp.]
MPDKPTALERALAARFQHQREQEAAHAPPFPRQELSAQPVPSPPAARRAAPGAAAALAAAILVALLFLPEREAPDVVYLEVIGASAMLTDGLLEVSAGVLPENGSLPHLYHVETGPASPGQFN